MFYQAVLLLVTVTMNLLGSKAIEWRDVSQPQSSHAVREIVEGRRVGQTFLAQRPNLSRVDVLLGTYGRTNTHDLVFRLREQGASEDLAVVTARAAEVADRDYFSFRFAPVADSEDKSYYFFLESPGAVPGDAFTVLASPTDAYPYGALILDGQATGGDLAFKTYAQENRPDVIAHQFVSRFFRHRPPFLNGVFFLVVGLFYGGLLVVGGVALFRSRG